MTDLEKGIEPSNMVNVLENGHVELIPFPEHDSSETIEIDIDSELLEHFDIDTQEGREKLALALRKVLSDLTNKDI